jgi:CheY-like chemotaxis protein
LLAASADEALALLQTVAPELIVVEDPLAGMGAVEFCRRVRALPEVEDAVVLVITQRSEDPELVLDAGATDLYPTTMGASFGHSDGRKVGQVFG